MKPTFLLVAFYILCTGCKQESNFTITGTIHSTEFNGEYVYLFNYGEKGHNPLDSALIENNKFTFRGTQNEPALKVLRLDEFVLPPIRPKAGQLSPFTSLLLLQNGKYTVNLDTVSIVKGTPENEQFNELIIQIAGRRKQIPSLIEAFKSNNASVYEPALQKEKEIEQEIRKTARDYILSHPDRHTAAKLFIDFGSSFSDKEKIDLLAKSSDTFKSMPGIQSIMEWLNSDRKTAIGKPFIDCTLPDINGFPVTLSQYTGNGKIILLDFWASWCGPCRESIPELKEIYQKYHIDNFEIIGISLDQSHTDWQKAVRELELPWLQLSDLKGWENEAALLYDINAIPQTYLINSKGIIIDKNAQGEVLEKRILEALNGKI